MASVTQGAFGCQAAWISTLISHFLASTESFYLRQKHDIEQIVLYKSSQVLALFIERLACILVSKLAKIAIFVCFETGMQANNTI